MYYLKNKCTTVDQVGQPILINRRTPIHLFCDPTRYLKPSPPIPSSLANLPFLPLGVSKKSPAGSSRRQSRAFRCVAPALARSLGAHEPSLSLSRVRCSRAGRQQRGALSRGRPRRRRSRNGTRAFRPLGTAAAAPTTPTATLRLVVRRRRGRRVADDVSGQLRGRDRIHRVHQRLVGLALGRRAAVAVVVMAHRLVRLLDLRCVREVLQTRPKGGWTRRVSAWEGAFRCSMHCDAAKEVCMGRSELLRFDVLHGSMRVNVAPTRPRAAPRGACSGASFRSPLPPSPRRRGSPWRLTGRRRSSPWRTP